MMFKFSKILLLVWWLTSTAYALPPIAGSGSTGGGFVVDCPETPVGATQTQILDLYEMERDGYSIIQSEGSLEEEYFESVDRTYTLQGKPNLAEERKNQIRWNLLNFMRSVIFVDSKEELPVATDLGASPWIPSQCQIKQVALFDDEASTVYILKPLWNKMNALNQAALVRHELTGWTYRMLGEPTSALARRTIAHHFIQLDQLVPLTDGLKPSAKQHTAKQEWIRREGSSSSSGTVISSFHSQVVYNGLGKIRRLQFSQLFGRSLLAKTWADFLYADWDFEGKYNPETSSFECLIKTPNMDHSIPARINGSLFKGETTLVMEMKTGQPLKLILMRDGNILNTNTLLPFSCLK